jgi:hypothetical protein
MVLLVEGRWNADFAAWVSCGNREAMRAGPARMVIVKDMVVDALYAVWMMKKKD